jgi:hypothetical protein
MGTPIVDRAKLAGQLAGILSKPDYRLMLPRE